jgi:hypothetical protein
MENPWNKYTINNPEPKDSLHDDFRKTIKWLREWSIDSNNDSVVNTIQDFQLMLEKSLELATKQIQIETEDNTNLLKSWLERIEALKSIDVEELNIAILRAIITQIADLIWFDFIIDCEKWIDELWNTTYEKLTWINTIINWEYRYTYWSLYRGGKIQVDDESYIEEQKKLNQIKEQNANTNDIYTLMEWLDDFWEVEYVDNPNVKEWPILVIFWENHEDWNWKVDLSSFKLQQTEIERMIVNGDFWLSSIAIESLLGEDIDTYWVDFEYESKNLMGLSMILYLVKKWMNMDQAMDIQWELAQKVRLYYRNQIWLQNLQSRTLNENWKWKNFIPIICWKDHMEDLAKNSKYRWFKGVIKFTWN